MKRLLLIAPFAGVVACTQPQIICNDDLFFDGKIGGPVSDCERTPAPFWGPSTMESDNDERKSRSTSPGPAEAPVESDDDGGAAKDVEDTVPANDSEPKASSPDDGAAVEPEQPDEQEQDQEDQEPVGQTEEEHESDGYTGRSEEWKEAHEAVENMDRGDKDYAEAQERRRELRRERAAENQRKRCERNMMASSCTGNAD